jgi:hypothetical protein
VPVRVVRVSVVRVIMGVSVIVIMGMAVVVIVRVGVPVPVAVFRGAVFEDWLYAGRYGDLRCRLRIEFPAEQQHQGRAKERE